MPDGNTWDIARASVLEALCASGQVPAAAATRVSPVCRLNNQPPGHVAGAADMIEAMEIAANVGNGAATAGAPRGSLGALLLDFRNSLEIASRPGQWNERSVDLSGQANLIPGSGCPTGGAAGEGLDLAPRDSNQEIDTLLAQLNSEDAKALDRELEALAPSLYAHVRGQGRGNIHTRLCIPANYMRRMHACMQVLWRAPLCRFASLGACCKLPPCNIVHAILSMSGSAHLSALSPRARTTSLSTAQHTGTCAHELK